MIFIPMACQENKLECCHRHVFSELSDIYKYGKEPTHSTLFTNIRITHEN